MTHDPGDEDDGRGTEVAKICPWCRQLHGEVERLTAGLRELVAEWKKPGDEMSVVRDQLYDCAEDIRDLLGEEV